MKKRGIKLAQASMEYLMVVGLVFVIIVPMVYVFYSYSIEMSEQVVVSKVEKIAGDIVNSAEEVFYLGEPSKTTVKFDMPPSVIDAYISPDKRELVFKVGDMYKFKEVVTYSNVNIMSYLVPPDLVAGKRSVRVEAMADHAVVYTGNITYARARWCVYSIATPLIKTASLVYSTKINRAVRINILDFCKPEDIYVASDNVVTTMMIGDDEVEFKMPSDVSLADVLQLPFVLGMNDYDLLYSSSNSNVVMALSDHCWDEDNDEYGTVMGSLRCGSHIAYDCDDLNSQIYPENSNTYCDCDASDGSATGAPEICDEIDNDCDGQVDDGFDLHADPENCGSCENVCPDETPCTDGFCLATP